ncbi:hypothetical protein [Chondrinema litorale]|uniref:hypothetical protein n=1 Tax=Chondrinema litorale TaxID=2994555 RepID=UPI002543E71A|nr:hypothetical protein [Chondrinema litorale]UZR96981.1 hypothetical protein OQ292_23060 [Chondrinema litorale]
MEESSIINQLASVQGRRDEEPNLVLAKQIAKEKKAIELKTLVEFIKKTKDTKIQSDCIKVIFEVGELEPSMLVAYQEYFIDLLTHKNNRLQWGSMAAILCISKTNPDLVFKDLPKLVAVAESGSVITRDNLVYILLELASKEMYREEMLILLAEIMLTCPTNQLPMYAEKAFPLINNSYKDRFAKLFESRLIEFEQESKKKRLQKIISKLL